MQSEIADLLVAIEKARAILRLCLLHVRRICVQFFDDGEKIDGGVADWTTMTSRFFQRRRTLDV